MKALKLTSFVFALGLLFSTGAFAQADIAATAVVQSTITVSGDQDLDFGTFADGTTTSITATSGNEASLGLFTVSAVTVGSDVDFDLDGPTTLASATTFDALPLTLEAELDTDNNLSGGTISFTLTDNDGTANISSTTQDTYYVYVGGTVDATNGANDYSGSYSGTITLSVSYN